ncbi:hypothetical protein SBF1_6930002 [Candidatus Desulfosporosinus infrequens]|uniref:YqaJ viral recombinase domain-containing protein n=1 Tax=Candidatus Desulfosporosinus infrequens TaxID=2043169 RepID=A0A2U3LPE0_9FIRM|nr:hypothetical protein SBF1_6930002 [Candidatus Desulfosporosinus infrequens]
MKEIDLIQGSDEWKIWRSQHLTATDSSIIMQTNPFRSRLSLWEEKTLGWEQQFTQKEMDRMNAGQLLEPLAREHFQKETGLIVMPIVGEHEEFSFLGASFDGFTSDRKYSIEIKCGKKACILAQIGEIPPYSLTQMQKQMFISDLDKVLYYCFDGQVGILLEVNRDNEFIEIMLAKEIEFWDCIQKFNQPD